MNRCPLKCPEKLKGLRQEVKLLSDFHRDNLKCPEKLKGLRHSYFLTHLYILLYNLKCPEKLKGLRLSFQPSFNLV